jgi:hypothetical protein
VHAVVALGMHAWLYEGGRASGGFGFALAAAAGISAALWVWLA